MHSYLWQAGKSGSDNYKGILWFRQIRCDRLSEEDCPTRSSTIFLPGLSQN
ncbi:MAG: hypothetical protein AAGA60_03560 [Cyanobacteria bacterium P01_E01_bin.42]